MIYPGLPNKAISIRQPWAFCIMELAKDIENRDWYTSYRGEVCVHAAKGMTNDEYEGCLGWVHYVSTIRPFKPGGVFPAKSEILRGGIVGTVEIIDCVGRSNSPWFFGKWGFVLANPKPIDFIPVKGSLGFFDWRKNLEVLA